MESKWVDPDANGEVASGYIPPVLGPSASIEAATLFSGAVDQAGGVVDFGSG